jgi:hypothetical protein
MTTRSAVLLIALLAPSGATAQEALRLEDVVAGAIDTHPELSAASWRAAAAGSAAAGARSTWWPSVGATTHVTRYQEPMVVAPLHGFDPSRPPAFDETLYQAHASVEYTLFDGGASPGADPGGRSGWRARRNAAAAAVADAVVAEAVSAYLGVLTAARCCWRTSARWRRWNRSASAPACCSRRAGRPGCGAADGGRAEPGRAERRRPRTRGGGWRASPGPGLGAGAGAGAGGALVAGGPGGGSRRPGRAGGAGAGGEPERLAQAGEPGGGGGRRACMRRAGRASPGSRWRVATARSGARRARIRPGVAGGGSGELPALHGRSPGLRGGAGARRRRRGPSGRELAERAVADAVDAALLAYRLGAARVEALEAAVAQSAEVARIEALALARGRGSRRTTSRAEAELLRARAALAEARHGWWRRGFGWRRRRDELDGMGGWADGRGER